LERLPCANPSSSRKHAFPRFHFPGAGSALGCSGTGAEAARLLHNPKGPCLEPPAMARARPGAPHTGQVRRAPCPFPQFRYVVRLDILWKLWADATWRRAPMPRSAQWIVYNTNHWGAVRPNMIPGKIRVPTLSFMPNETMTLLAPNVGQLKNVSSERMIVLRRNSRRR